eukprot:TRINITY_DN7800_c0_g1_i1.p1 TRINITY_DN7800_c0_g1~~TRINITY_DN7800_c0_g1_i1.p1  ORF type:complete len:556 (-),score=87.90 TRINITY_DN7800_c0_g1_i1:22-1689(-)
MMLRAKLTNITNQQWFLLMSVYFIVIASVLGTGILGLPVKLAHSGFLPFVASYSICFLMQLLVLYFVIELLQRGTAIRQHEWDSNLINDSAAEDTFFSIDDSNPMPKERPMKGGNGGGGGITSSGGVVNNGHDHGVDLHYLGGKFLTGFSCYVFDAAVMLHFITILISYGLAGSGAYAHMFHVAHKYLIFPFIFGFTLVIIFGARFLRSTVSILTFMKGSLLFLIVGVTGVVANHVHNHISSNWAYTGRSFLISTVALGGAANVLPVVFSRIGSKPKDMIKLMIAATLGLTTVYILNIFWCYFLLLVIPQTSPANDPTSISLVNTQIAGQIATIPLIEIIEQKYPQYKWIAFLIDLFIMVSITVSYITMGSGMKHNLDGMANSWRKSATIPPHHHDPSSDKLAKIKNYLTLQLAKLNHFLDQRETEFEGRPHHLLPDDTMPPSPSFSSSFRKQFVSFNVREIVLYFLSFSLILIIAMANPRSFLIVLEKGSSLGVNLQTGVLTVAMLINSRAPKYHKFTIPFPIPKYLFMFRYIVMFYFSFACVYDVVTVFGEIM